MAFTIVEGQVVLIDQDGNPILSVLDGSNLRLAVEAAIKPGSSIGITPAATPVTTAFNPYLRETGGSEEMAVDGDPTPVVFEVTADPDDDLVLQELRFVMIADAVEWLHFGKGGGDLTNGILIEAQLDGAVASTELFNIRDNEDFFRMQSPVKDSSSGDAIIGASLGFAGEILGAGSTDFVRVTIRDDIGAVLRKIFKLNATLYTRRQTPVP